MVTSFCSFVCVHFLFWTVQSSYMILRLVVTTLTIGSCLGLTFPLSMILLLVRLGSHFVQHLWPAVARFSLSNFAAMHLLSVMCRLVRVYLSRVSLNCRQRGNLTYQLVTCCSKVQWWCSLNCLNSPGTNWRVSPTAVVVVVLSYSQCGNMPVCSVND